MHCLIIEDRKQLQPGFTEMVERVKGIEAVHTAIHPYEIKYLLRTVPVSLVICSPQLWNHEYVAGLKSVPKVIFLSNTKQKIREELEGYKIAVLREPYSPLHLERLINKQEVTAVSDLAFLLLKFERRWHRLLFADIELVEKKPGNFVQIFTRTGSFLVSGTLQNWLKRLPEDRFIRPCDGLIVQASELSKFTGEVYEFRGREIRLTFRMAKKARREMESFTTHF